MAALFNRGGSNSSHSFNRGVNYTRRARGHGNMEFPGLLKKERVSIKKEVESPGGDQEKVMWNCHGSCLLYLKFPRGVT